MWRRPVLLALVIGCATGGAPPPGPAGGPAPPVAPRVPWTRTVHGETLQDEYHWLRNKDAPEVRKYLEAENAYTAAVTAPLAGLRERLYQEIVGRIKETDLTVPYKDGEYLYYARTEKGKQYSIRCRTRAPSPLPADLMGAVAAAARAGHEEVTVDLNEIAAREKLRYAAVGRYEVSDDARLLAFSLDRTGFRQYTLYVKDLRTGALDAHSVPRTRSVAWAADGKTYFYAVENDAKRPYRVYRHVLGQPAGSEDPLVYEERDERFEVEVERSRSRALVFIASHSMTASEWRFVRAEEPAAAATLVAPREPDHEYHVDHHGQQLYIRTNKGARNFRLVTAPLGKPGPAEWKELVAHRPRVMLEGVDLFRGHYVLEEREDGLDQITVVGLGPGAPGRHSLRFPEAVYSASLDTNREFDATRVRYRYQSPVTPPSVYEHDVATNKATLLKRTEVLGGYDPARYTTERIHAVAGDGARIPVSVVMRRGLARDGRAPLMLNGYGAYGAAISPGFDAADISLLDRGVVVATAHVRGGGEMGKAWHDQGRMLAKKNSFTDFIAAAEHLVRARYTSPDRLIAGGGSAGGLLMGAVANLRPDLFKAMLIQVPFVDVINTMLDPTLPLTVTEFEEWGNPEIPEQYRYLRSYCPYTNIGRRAYPAMLVRTSLHDSQVMYWEPAKYVARMRALRTDPNPLLLHVNMSAGHGGSSGRYDQYRESAFDFAFLLWQWGLAGR